MKYCILSLVFLLSGTMCFSQDADSLSSGVSDTLKSENSDEEADSQALPDSTAVEARPANSNKLENLRNDPSLKFKEPPTIAESLWDRLLLWLRELFSAIFEGAIETNWGKLFTYIVGILVIVVLVMMMLKVNAFKVFYSGEGASTFKYNALTENIHEMDFEKLIDDALARKDYRGGVRLVFLYSLKMLSDKNHIHWSQGKTNHDYVDELEVSELQSGFNDLNYYFEYAWYGDFKITAEMFSHVRNIFDGWKGNIK